MATDLEIERAFKIVLGAGLDFTPTRDDIPNRVDTWGELLADIPGTLLIQAAKDIAISGEKFPSIPQMRRQAAEVRAHNGTSAAPDHFKPIPEPVIIWLPAEIKDRAIFPTNVQAEIDRLASLDRLLTDDEMAHIDELTAPYRI